MAVVRPAALSKNRERRSLGRVFSLSTLIFRKIALPFCRHKISMEGCGASAREKSN